ncbi:MAG: hypothetical protein ACREUK_08995 [Burkholderiales bacterium]
MLREVLNPRQAPGEPYRRCFFSHEQDLWVWFGDAGMPIAFQLAYGKYRNEHAIRWKLGRGFMHERVDDGENAGVVKQSPILVHDGPFDAEDVVARFLEKSQELPRDIVEFVTARLREYPAE